MNRSTVKIALFVCIACIVMVGASLFFSVSLTNKYSDELAVFNYSGEKLNQISNSYEYTEYTKNIINSNSNDKGDALAVFEYENIDFVSYSTEWDSEKLELLAHELFNNVHGEEIAYVARVELLDDNYDEYAGLHRSSYERHSLPISINRLLPDDMTLDFSALSSVIVLTGANENTTVASMARTLSHEYGHHFTQHYFGFRGTDDDMRTKYASLRKEADAPIYAVITDWTYYMENHMWDIQEIAAEDYVFFMGSQLAKRQIDYLDNKEQAKLYSTDASEYNKKSSESIISYNSFPHENPVLRSPSQVDGLSEYYYSFVDETALQYTEVTSYGKLDMNLTQTSTGSYTITWALPWTYSNISYTLVAYDMKDNILRPIKTIAGDEEPIAYFGLQKATTSIHEFTIDDTLDELGYVRFRVVVTFSDETVVFSDPYDVQF